MIRLAECTATVTCQRPWRSGVLQALQAAQIAGEFAQPPLLGQRLLQALQVAERRLDVGLFDLDVVQADHRIELDRAHLGALPDHLLVHLTVGRHVDDDVPEQHRLAGQPAAGQHFAVALPIALLGRPRRRDVGRPRADAVLGELAFRQGDLAAAAQRPAAAYRIDVDPELRAPPAAATYRRENARAAPTE